MPKAYTYLANGSYTTPYGYESGGTERVYRVRRNVQGDVEKLVDVSGTVVVEYVYDAWGNHTVHDTSGEGLGTLNSIRYRGYIYDTETGLYYLQSRYYDPEVGRFLSADSIEYLDPETINGLNLYAYCGNNPVMRTDPSGTSWWSWLISGLQVLGGIALLFVPGAQGMGGSLIVGGALGLISNAVAPAIGQAIGGVSSIANGWGAFSMGASILGLGAPGLIGGIALMLVGGGTMVFGANEVVAALSGTNYLQQWTGISDTIYGWTYFGLNLASSFGQIAGIKYRQFKTRATIYNPDGSVKQYRYFQGKDRLYDVDFNHPAYGNPNIKFPHYHGWANAEDRAKDHQSYIQLIIWLLFRRR